jgi:hypothetical protein
MDEQKANDRDADQHRHCLDQAAKKELWHPGSGGGSAHPR